LVDRRSCCIAFSSAASMPAPRQDQVVARHLRFNLREEIACQQSAIAEHNRPVNGIFKLPDVPRPIVLRYKRHGVGRDA
jgi:hypothetical protein